MQPTNCGTFPAQVAVREYLFKHLNGWLLLISLSGLMCRKANFDRQAKQDSQVKIILKWTHNDGRAKVGSSSQTMKQMEEIKMETNAEQKPEM